MASDGHDGRTRGALLRTGENRDDVGREERGPDDRGTGRGGLAITPDDDHDRVIDVRLDQVEPLESRLGPEHRPELTLDDLGEVIDGHRQVQMVDDDRGHPTSMVRRDGWAPPSGARADATAMRA